ncbi:hypothetical protein JW872_01215 [Candidatus Babeliales bacterium]|nr:hypothetical protein [Candidatus Babeliales bacterium]
MKRWIFVLAYCALHGALIQALDDGPSMDDIDTNDITPTDQQEEQAGSTTRAFTDAQLLNALARPDGTLEKKNDDNRYNTPFAAQFGMMAIGGGFCISDIPNLFQNNYPSASQFFPNNGSLASSFSSLQTSVAQDPIFYVYLKQMYTTVLRQLYSHLKKILATFILTKIDTLDTFVTYEQQYAFNEKFLIVEHLINIVDAQSYKFSQALFSALPKSIAAFTGKTILHNDTNVNLTLLTIDDATMETGLNLDAPTREAVKNKQAAYKQIFGTYFNLFRTYTNLILQKPTAQAYLGENELVRDMTSMRTLVKSYQEQNKPIVPQFFFPSQGTIRAVRVIPLLIENIPTTSQLIDWPVQYVTAAVQGTHARNAATNAELPFRVAFFKDSQGNEISSQGGAQALFVNMPSGNAIFEQELLRQPTWLNSPDDIIKVTRGCLGDFTALIGLNILKPETEGIILRMSS